MKILFHLGHPAHFHLFKNSIRQLIEKQHEVLIVIKKKDVLEDLLIASGFEYINILPEGRKDGKLFVALGQLKQDLVLWKVARKFKPDLMAGTSVAISHVGKLLGIPTLNVNEDDAAVVPLYAKLAYPWATSILAPEVCSTGKWTAKKISYDGYHELAYLHPGNFTPDKKVASKYLDPEKPYFIIRFAKLTAHHDDGIKGITIEIAQRIIALLKPHGSVFITSERPLEKELEAYRINIDPVDMHHVMAYASIYIGDSQTMAAEAGVLGIPFVRFNGFVGRISYLKELEEKYALGFGVLPQNLGQLFEKIEYLIYLEDRRAIFQERRQKMLADKINSANFITWIIDQYPSSLQQLKKDPGYQLKFK